MSTFHGLEIGRRGLTAGQASISTTGHNIANADTKGYSRQKVNQSASTPLNVWTNGGQSQLGSGVSVDSITRIRDRFLDGQLRSQSSTLGEAETKQAAFDRLELAVNEPSDTGLNAAMDRLANAWQDVANDPDSPSAQAVVKQRAQEFIEVARSLNDSMTAMKSDLETQKSAVLTQAEGILSEIDELNDSIRRSGSQSNDLLDQRDAAVEALAKLVPVEVEEKNSIYTISFPSEDLTYDNGSLTLAEGGTVTGGQLGGLIEALNIVDGYQNGNETVAGLEGIVTEFARANGDLFLNTDSIDGLEVNFAAGPLTAPLNLQEAMKAPKSDFQTLVSVLGTQSQAAARSAGTAEAALQATENRRQSVSGVSLDEEMANLIKFQHAYSAAARLITTTDEMLDTIINRMAR